MMIRNFFIFTVLLSAFFVSAINKSFKVTVIDLSKSKTSINHLIQLRNDFKIQNKNISEIFIARKVLKVISNISAQEPIKLGKMNIAFDGQPAINLLNRYKQIREKFIVDESVNKIPSLLVRSEQKNKDKLTEIYPAEIFTDFKKLKKDLFSHESLSSRIVLAENEVYSKNNKPFSKYISKGVPGLSKKTAKKMTAVVDPVSIQNEKVEIQKISIKQSSSLQPLIDMYEARNNNKINKKTVKETQSPVNTRLSSQKLLNAIKAVNGPEKKMDSQRKKYEIDNSLNPLMVDMSKVAATTTTDLKLKNKDLLQSNKTLIAKKSELFGELAIQKDSRCIQPYILNSLKRKKYKSALRIGADSFMLDKGFKPDVSDYYLEFSDTYNDIHYSDKGIIEFENILLSNRFSVRRATIYKSFHYPTVTDLVFENDDLATNIPLIEMDSLAKIMKELPQIQFDAHALIELDQGTEDVNLIGASSKYIYKFYLNDNMKVVKPGSSDYTYIFLTNIKPGNYFLEYEKNNGSKVSKIVHVESEKVYFDSNYYVSETKDQFALYENDLLTKCAYEVDVESNRLISISDQKLAKKISTNNYEFDKISYPLGTRKYYEIKYENTSLFIGRQDTKKAVIPSKDYVEYVFDQFNINSLNGMCIIQLNLNKRADDIKVNMTSPNYASDYDLLVLDQDGLFYKDFTANSNRVFILGTEQGVANIKLNYIDGSVDYIQSYCSDDSYLVEEL